MTSPTNPNHRVTDFPKFKPKTKDPLQLVFYPPVNTALPTLTGTAEVGEILSASTGSWTSPPWPPTFLYYWLRDGVDIFGYARPTTYRITSADVGHELSVKVVATNRDGTSEATSLPTTIGTIEGGGDTPEWLPDGAIAYADFVNGHYYAGGAETTATSMFQSDTVDGDTFSPEKIESAVGYVSQADGSDTPAFSFVDTSAILPGATYVIEYENGTDGLMYLMEYTQDTYSTQWDAQTRFDGIRLRDTATTATDENPLSVGLHKWALTFDAAGLGLSIDGGSVLSVSPAVVNSPSNTVTGYFSNGVVVKSITIYPPVADADLPALSAL